MNWNDYEKMLINQIKDAKLNLEHAEKEYKQCYVKYDVLLTQHKTFQLALKEMLGDD